MKYCLQCVAKSLLLIVVSFSTYAIHDYPADEFWLPSNESNSASIDHSQWQSILDEYLKTDTASGIHRVDYSGLKARGLNTLNRYLDTMSAIAIGEYSRAEQFAFWVNLYNAVTVKLIADNYPVKSIMKLGGWFAIGPWDEKLITVAGRALTLNDIEHRILRPIWQDFRIHFVVNCASIGCPDLAAQAVTGSNANQLMDQAAREFLQHPRGLAIKDGKLKLSKIFKWYRSDFADNDQQLLLTLTPFLSNAQRQAIGQQRPPIRYHYDWALNRWSASATD